MRVAIVDRVFNPWQELERHQSKAVAPGRWGALACFVGALRAEGAGEHGAQVQAMTLEHYPEMSQAYLQDLAETALQNWGITELLLVHRVGRIELGEAIMIVACWSGHRRQAFYACEQIVERLKSTVPFWKKEHTASGEHWVARNTPA